jgi:hypothetical protein
MVRRVLVARELLVGWKSCQASVYVTPECSESPALSRSTVEKQTTIHSFIWTWTIRRPAPCGSHGTSWVHFRCLGRRPRYLCRISLMAGADRAATGKSASEASELIEVWEKIYERFAVGRICERAHRVGEGTEASGAGESMEYARLLLQKKDLHSLHAWFPENLSLRLRLTAVTQGFGRDLPDNLDGPNAVSCCFQ